MLSAVRAMARARLVARWLRPAREESSGCTAMGSSSARELTRPIWELVKPWCKRKTVR